MEQGTTAGPHGRVAHNFIDRTGERFGQLVVVSLAERRAGVVYWLCKCDCGGPEKVIAGSSLGAGLSTSCGCTRRKPKPGFDKTPGVTARGIVLGQYQRGAAYRGLAWDLTGEDFDRLTSRDCYYCGHAPSTVKRSGMWDTGFIYNGIDRMDNTLGYTPGNVVPCCEACNRAKGTVPFEEFMAWIAQLTEYHWFHPEVTPSRLLRGGGQPPGDV